MSRDRAIALWGFLLASPLLLLACQLDYILSSDAAAEKPTETKTLGVISTPTTVARVAVPVVSPTPSPIPIRVYAIATGDLRVRGAPSTSAPVVGQLKKGDALQVIGRTPANDWWQVILPANPNASAWVFAEYTTLNASINNIPVVQPQQAGTPQAPTVQSQPQQAGTPRAPTAPPSQAQPSPTKPATVLTPGPTQPAGSSQPSPTVPSYFFNHGL